MKKLKKLIRKVELCYYIMLETSSFTMFIAVDERTLVNMQPLGIQQYFIGQWCHQRLEKFQYRHFTNFVYKSRLHN